MFTVSLILLEVFLSVVIAEQPNIVFIFIDDLGWNDVGYHGSEIMTPTVDNLAAQGLKLENYYVQKACSPTRGTLLTGRYQIHTCLNSKPVFSDEVGGLSLDEVTLPDRLRKAGYSTHMVGKWHLGFSSVDYVPTYRGFDTFFGKYAGAGDHFTHETCNSGVCGNDLHDDVGTTLVPVTTESGTYTTYLYTEKAVEIIENHSGEQPLFLYLNYNAVHTPLQAPQEYLDMYPDIEDEDRRYLAAMMTCVDDGIANVTQALQAKGLWNNTIFIFSTDNGGGSGSDNSPLRGAKGQYFEGGIHGAAFITSPLLSTTGVAYNGLMHVSDWFRTLINKAGGDVSDLELDGIDFWESLSDNTESPRAELLHNIDPLIEMVGENSYPDIYDIRVQSSLRSGPWKIMTGSHSPPFKNLWLFNIEDDPFETSELSSDFPRIVENLLERLAAYNETAVPVCELDEDLEGADPDNHGGNWMPWL